MNLLVLAICFAAIASVALILIVAVIALIFRISQQPKNAEGLAAVVDGVLDDKSPPLTEEGGAMTEGGH